MGASKPESKWQTRAHVAYRRPHLPSAWQSRSRAEAFDLHFHDGRRGEALLALDAQFLCATAASDPDMLFAARAWLIARGQRRMSLRIEGDSESRTDATGPADLSRPSGHTPARIVTLCPSNAEMVHALQCFDRVIACEDSSDFPPEVAQLPRLGPDLAPDLARVSALAPDLVVSSLSVPGMERNVIGLRREGIAQCVLAPRSLSDVLEEVARLGRALDVAVAAQHVSDQLRRESNELRRARPTSPVRVYLEWWPKPMFTPGADCYSNELIELAGGQNVFGDRPGASIEVDAAQLHEADPDVCFLSWCGVPAAKLSPAQFAAREGFGDLRAVRAGRVYPLDERFAGRPGPRMLEASRVMAKAIRQCAQPG